jgi:hypothetical protein
MGYSQWPTHVRRDWSLLHPERTFSLWCEMLNNVLRKSAKRVRESIEDFSISTPVVTGPDGMDVITTGFPMDMMSAAEPNPRCDTKGCQKFATQSCQFCKCRKYCSELCCSRDFVADGHEKECADYIDASHKDEFTNFRQVRWIHHFFIIFEIDLFHFSALTIHSFWNFITNFSSWSTK